MSYGDFLTRKARAAGDGDSGGEGAAVKHWVQITKFDPRGARLADGHYSRRKVGSPQFMPPGETIILLTSDELAVFGWWRPHPRSGIRAMNGLDGWTCTIFRNTGPMLSSALILDAERALDGRTIGPDRMLTYVWDRKVRSANPGYCFKVAGWRAIGRSADGRKTLLHKEPGFWPGQVDLPQGQLPVLKPATSLQARRCDALSGAAPPVSRAAA